MKFGSVSHPEHIDFSLPEDHPKTRLVLEQFKDDNVPEIYVGCAKWNKADLKHFYPKGTKDELGYYASQFNSIELNATFYRIFSAEQFAVWKHKTPQSFKFFPKINQTISHYKRLTDVKAETELLLTNASQLEDKLGCFFLQLHTNFSPDNFRVLSEFLNFWPEQYPLAVEFRHSDWFNDVEVANNLYQLLETHNISNIIVDTAGRRDLLHMRLTNARAFVRYVGANHSSDYKRLDDWVERLKLWQDQGIKEIDFFIHQNTEKESPLLAAYFIKALNKALGSQLKIPNDNTNSQQNLFT
ncbi:DUF72 domain-containing protein [Formosa sp. A9]|uniref:DUF72 domain-containing protein n=1 Tax=Formosa sp. A9 TaxID=3442641 RepID=UPI003EBDD180